MLRVPEPELMDSEEQALAYAQADFAEPHERFVTQFREAFPGLDMARTVLDLGCGPADVTVRFAKGFPLARIDGIDAGPNMLKLASDRVRREGLAERVRLTLGRLPVDSPPLAQYGAVISNSLLHHLADPAVLWNAVRKHTAPGAPVFVMDLARPADEATLDALVARYAEGEPDILRNDFRNSLKAAYRPDEVREQLARAGLSGLRVHALGDRHLTVSGFAPG
jgi:SAM-dependent methyltransferase